jgi:hypothetical protein
VPCRGQFFYDISKFQNFYEKCRSLGITVPILPGYLPIQNYNSFRKFTSWCKTAVPAHIDEALEKIRDDDEQVRPSVFSMVMVPQLLYVTQPSDSTQRKTMQNLRRTRVGSIHGEFTHDVVSTVRFPFSFLQVKAFGVQESIAVCRALLQQGHKSLHFYTMNLEQAVTQVIEGELTRSRDFVPEAPGDQSNQSNASILW